MDFSVIIPNYNHAKYLPEQLDAILSQSLQPLEVLVVDDASTDDSCEVVAQYQKKYPHLSLLRLEKNSGGPIVPVQVGLSKVRGDYVVLCASDDIVQPGFFKEAMECAAAHPEAALCFGKFVIFEDRKPYQYQEISLSLLHTPRVFSPDEWVAFSRKYHLDIPSQSALYKKSALMEVGGYDESLKGYSDYYVNYQLSFKYPVAYVPNVWGANRVVRGSYGRDLPAKERIDLCAQLIQKLEKEPEIFQDRWRKSGILARAGKGMLIYLLQNIWHWKYIPSLLAKYTSYRVKKQIALRK